MWMDATNAVFETIGALVVLLNVRALLRDRRIAGVHWAPTVFFTTWGIWNVLYYPALGQWASAAAGVLLALANIAWLVLVWRFRPRPVRVPVTRWHCRRCDEEVDMEAFRCCCVESPSPWEPVVGR